jgi:hypothetical protein
MRRNWLLAAALAGVAVVVAVLALTLDNGSSDQQKVAGFPGNTVGRKPLIFDIGGLIYSPDPGVRDRAIREAHSLGADALRVPILWNLVAPAQTSSNFHPSDPTDPAYNWAAYDDTIKEAKDDGLRVLLMPTGPAPIWASSSQGAPGVTDPDPKAFGDFVSALAKRYGGGFDPDRSGPAGPLPKADLWTIWNEPNLSTFLQPQHRGGRPYSPLLYRRLYLAGQAAIHAQDPSAPILIGETAPTGGESSVDPLTFTRQTLCLNGDYKPLPGCPEPDASIDAVGWSTHPYPLVGRPPYEPVQNAHFVTMSSLGNLQSALSSAADAGAIPSDFPIYITEFGIQSFPDPNAVSLQAQAADIAIAEKFAYDNPSVVTFAQYLMNDDDPQTTPGVAYGGFESGLRFFDGRRKPAYEAMRLPLAIQQIGDTVSLWGIVQPYPHATTVTIRYRNPGRPPRTLQQINTDPIGVYTTTYGDSPGRRWQVVWHSPLDGKTFRSPWTKSYEYAAPG